MHPSPFFGGRLRWRNSMLEFRIIFGRRIIWSLTLESELILLLITSSIYCRISIGTCRYVRHYSAPCSVICCCSIQCLVRCAQVLSQHFLWHSKFGLPYMILYFANIFSVIQHESSRGEQYASLSMFSSMDASLHLCRQLLKRHSESTICFVKTVISCQGLGPAPPQL